MCSIMRQFSFLTLLLIGMYSPYQSFSQFVYVESHLDNATGGNSIMNLTGMEISPDGNFVYTAGAEGISVFSVNQATAQLTYEEDYKDGVDASYISSPKELAVSPDGSHLYTVGENAVTVWTRNAGSGLLTYVEEHRDGVSGVDGLSGTASLVVSPDGNHVYALGTSSPDDAVAVFSRNGGSGALTFVEAKLDGVNYGNGVIVQDNPRDIVVSPDGLHVYVASYTSSVVTKYSRNSGTGALTYLGTDGNAGTEDVEGLGFSPDGNFLYVTAKSATANLNAVTAWTRNSGDGDLTYSSAVQDNTGGVTNLYWPQTVQISSDGLYALVAVSGEGSVLVFDRDVATGVLTVPQALEFLSGAGGIPASAVGNSREAVWGPNADMFFSISYNEYINAFKITTLDRAMGEFWGLKNDNTVDIYWNTLSEMDNDHFEIERSYDGQRFYKIGEVLAQGNTSIGHEYSFIDSEFLSRDSYYRIKSVDIKGLEEYTEAIKISPSELSQFSVFPNPFNSDLKIRVPEGEEAFEIEVYDIDGRLQSFDLEEGLGYRSVNTDGLASGVYFIKIRSNNKVFKAKIIKR